MRVFSPSHFFPIREARAGIVAGAGDCITPHAADQVTELDGVSLASQFLAIRVVTSTVDRNPHALRSVVCESSDFKLSPQAPPCRLRKIFG